MRGLGCWTSRFFIYVYGPRALNTITRVWCKVAAYFSRLKQCDLTFETSLIHDSPAIGDQKDPVSKVCCVFMENWGRIRRILNRTTAPLEDFVNDIHLDYYSLSNPFLFSIFY